MNSDRRNESADVLFAGPGAIRALCRSIDWSSSLGPGQDWPQGLAGAVRICLDSAAPMVVLVGRDLTLLYNDACVAAGGSVAHPSALGRPARDVWPQLWERLGPELARMMERGEAVVLESLSSSGSPSERAALACTCAPIRERDGRTAGALLLIHPSEPAEADVPGRELLSLALRLASVGVWELDLVDLTARRFLCDDEIFGYSQRLPRWTYEMFLEHVVPEDRGEVDRKVRGAMDPGGDCQFDCRILRRDGQTRWIWMSGRYMAASGGRHPRVAGIIQDITERKRADESLRRSEETFAKAFQGNTSAMAIVRWRDGVLVEVNESFVELMRLPRERLIGKSTVEIGIWKDPEQRTRYLHDIERKGMIRNSELRLTRPTGEPWVGLLSSQLVELRGEPVTISSIVDITERKLVELALEQANARLVEADRRKDAFLATLSHELRNPLAPIKNGLFILARTEPGGYQARRAIEIVERQVAQLSRLVDDLLDLTRITRGKIHLQRGRVELNELTARTLEDHLALFEKRAVKVELRTAPTDVVIRADRYRIAQIIGNLLQNAAKFTPAGGRVSLEVLRDPGAGRAVIRVSDTGVGLSADTLAHIFEPFRQADTSLARSQGGLGLGLSLVKALVERHGGSVEATSAGAGKGAEFVVRLPLELGPQATSEPSQPANATVHRRVLIIDDNVDGAETLRDALELEGHEVAVAYDGPKGLAKAYEFHPDFVLCDIGLPGMDGYTVARAFRSDQALSKAHLVALTGYSLPEDLERSAGAGFEQHLAKPPSFEKLRNVLSGAPAQS